MCCCYDTAVVCLPVGDPHYRSPLPVTFVPRLFVHVRYCYLFTFVSPVDYCYFVVPLWCHLLFLCSTLFWLFVLRFIYVTIVTIVNWYHVVVIPGDIGGVRCCCIYMIACCSCCCYAFVIRSCCLRCLLLFDAVRCRSLIALLLGTFPRFRCVCWCVPLLRFTLFVTVILRYCSISVITRLRVAHVCSHLLPAFALLFCYVVVVCYCDLLLYPLIAVTLLHYRWVRCWCRVVTVCYVWCRLFIYCSVRCYVTTIAGLHVIDIVVIIVILLVLTFVYWLWWLVVEYIVVVLLVLLWWYCSCYYIVIVIVVHYWWPYIQC